MADVSDGGWHPLELYFGLEAQDRLIQVRGSAAALQVSSVFLNIPASAR